MSTARLSRIVVTLRLRRMGAAARLFLVVTAGRLRVMAALILPVMAAWSLRIGLASGLTIIVVWRLRRVAATLLRRIAAALLCRIVAVRLRRIAVGRRGPVSVRHWSAVAGCLLLCVVTVGKWRVGSLIMRLRHNSPRSGRTYRQIRDQ